MTHKGYSYPQQRPLCMNQTGGASYGSNRDLERGFDRTGAKRALLGHAQIKTPPNGR